MIFSRKNMSKKNIQNYKRGTKPIKKYIKTSSYFENGVIGVFKTID